MYTGNMNQSVQQVEALGVGQSETVWALNNKNNKTSVRVPLPLSGKVMTEAGDIDFFLYSRCFT